MTATRGYLTTREKCAILKMQNWRCGCSERCGQPLWPGAPVHWDHRPPLALGGPRKPNQGVTPHCHLRLTQTDVHMIRKADRQAKATRSQRTRKGRRLRSRGFQGWRRFNGEIVRRV